VKRITTIATTTTADRHVVYQVPMSNGRELQGYLQEHEGRMLAHIRLMYVCKDGTTKPTRYGISVEVEKLNELLTATAMLSVAVNRDSDLRTTEANVA
jgi:Transcriptional Coactivator p15 (PC4)